MLSASSNTLVDRFNLTALSALALCNRNGAGLSVIHLVKRDQVGAAVPIGDHHRPIRRSRLALPSQILTARSLPAMARTPARQEQLDRKDRLVDGLGRVAHPPCLFRDERGHAGPTRRSAEATKDHGDDVLRSVHALPATP